LCGPRFLSLEWPLQAAIFFLLADPVRPQETACAGKEPERRFPRGDVDHVLARDLSGEKRQAFKVAHGGSEWRVGAELVDRALWRWRRTDVRQRSWANLMITRAYSKLMPRSFDKDAPVSPRSSHPNHQFSHDPWRSLSPLRPGAGFRYTQPFGSSAKHAVGFDTQLLLKPRLALQPAQ